MEIGKIIRQSRIKKGLTITGMSKITGIPIQTISNIELGESKSPSFEVVAKICNELNLDMNKLYAVQCKNSPAKISEAKITESYPVPRLRDWSQLIEMLYNQTIDEDFIDVIFAPRQCNAHCYALIVSGDSMKGTGNTSFPEGTTIIVDPKRDWKSGDFVIAKESSSQDWALKRILNDMGKNFLASLNSDYPMREINKLDVAGVVIHSINSFE